MPPLKLSEIEYGSADYTSALVLRDEVLRRPLGLSFSDDEIRQESNDIYLACHVADKLVGCLVLVPQDSAEIRMRQVAVASHVQGQGIGRALVGFAEQFSREHGFTLMTLHSRDTAIPFYEKLGYECVGEPFVEVTIPHQAMQKRLPVNGSSLPAKTSHATRGSK